MVRGWDPIRKTHLNDRQMRPFNRFVKGVARARITAVHEGSSAFVFKSIAVGFDGIVVMNIKAFPGPSVIGTSNIPHVPLNGVKHAFKRTGEGQLAEGGEPLLHKRRSDHTQGLRTLPVGDVFSFEQEKWKAKDMVTVNMGNEDGLDACNIVTQPTQSRERSGGCIDDVLAVNHRERMVSAMGEEGVPRSHHVHAMGHEAPTLSFFFCSSVVRDGKGDVKSYQP